MHAVEVKNGIHWVGAVDWPIRDFHGYATPRGTSYNNYLILDDEVTLIDTVKDDFWEYSRKNIVSLVDPATIKHVVVNHIENDHATGLPRLMALCPKATIHITSRGRKGLERFFDMSAWDVRIVATGDTLNIGKRTLMFLETPMLHWPDSMMTWVPEDEVLFSQDGFGQHIASVERFDDEFTSCESKAVLKESVIDYYANILMPFGGVIKSKIEEIQKLGLKPQIIAPDHGVIWRRDAGDVVQSYLDMAAGKARLRVAIIYDTMWKSTQIMSVSIAQGIADAGVECKIIKLRATPTSGAITEVFKSRGFLVGTPTLNNIMYPTVAQFLTHLRGLRPKDRIAGAFGSYGWAGGAVKEAYAELERMKLPTFDPGVQVLYRPSPDDEASCYEFGRAFAELVKEKQKKYE
ncbi:MAG: FprA family A-type flavoprotein [Thermoleophilia bacterium]